MQVLDHYHNWDSFGEQTYNTWWKLRPLVHVGIDSKGHGNE